MSRPFFNYQYGSIVFGVFPIFRIMIDWRDAEDGVTLIKPLIRFVRWR